jgi:hypothetical protein
MMHVCEHCWHRAELRYVRRCDAYLCEECEEIAVEELIRQEEREEED